MAKKFQSAKRFQSLGGILERLIQEWGGEKELTLYRLAKHWQEVVGPQIALHTVPQTIRFHTLTLAVDSAPWMNQLLFFKKEIIQKTNRFVKKPLIEDIYFKMMPLFSERHGLSPRTDIPEKTAYKKQADQPLSVEPERAVATLSKKINAVQDDALHKTIQAAIARYFHEDHKKTVDL